MDGDCRSLIRSGIDLDLIHEAFHDRKPHTAALFSTSRVKRFARLFHILNAAALVAYGDGDLARIVELKRQTHQEVLNRREIGEPLTVIEIPVDPGISIEFRQEICGLTQPQMIKLAQAFLEVIKSEKDKEAQEEKE